MSISSITCVDIHRTQCGQRTQFKQRYYRILYNHWFKSKGLLQCCVNVMVRLLMVPSRHSA